MLNYNEIETIGKLKKLSLINSEKDYLQDIVLFSIYSNIGKELVFKGGTCLYKIYKLNRFSEDLDFTLIKEIDAKKLVDKIISDLMLLNIKCRLKDIKEYKNEINIRLLINGPLYKGSKETQCFVSLNISKKERILIEAKKETIISLYKEIPSFEVFAMQEKEILAEKVRAIFTRMKARDIYDLWFLIKLKNITLDYELINKKLSLYDINFDPEEFKKRIDKFKGLWQIDLKNLIIGTLQDFNKIKSEIFDKIFK